MPRPSPDTLILAARVVWRAGRAALSPAGVDDHRQRPCPHLGLAATLARLGVGRPLRTPPAEYWTQHETDDDGNAEPANQANRNPSNQHVPPISAPCHSGMATRVATRPFSLFSVAVPALRVAAPLMSPTPPKPE